MVDKLIPKTLLVVRYEFHVARRHRATATRFSKGTAFLNDVCDFSILSCTKFMRK